LAFTPGSRIGPYQLASRIGAGGMGEVYRARDTTLNRQVAIKVLLPAVANDPDRLARFRREAQVLAALNHPHIAQIHGFEEADGVRALVMELVDGPTLADRIAGGAIAMVDALPIATQIAEALEAAHEQGIIHRDLKPANIKVRDDGTVKVLDFGLAKALATEGASAPADATSSPTLSAHATATGLILGTAAYMSPEQARGRPVDRRADLWAFGCVLYEMLTGQRAFPGEGASDTLAHVLMKEPDWHALPADTPVPIRRLLRRCVEKDRKKRLDSATAARLEIDDARADPSARPPARERVSTRMAWFVAAASIVAALAAGVAAMLPWRRVAPELAVLRLDVTTPQTSDPTSFALSPDGRQVVFVAAGDSGSQLWLRRLDQTMAQPLPDTEGATFPFWAPDSRAIGFFADAKLKRLDLPGGKAQELADAANGFGGAWSRDGVIVYAANAISGLLRVPATGGTPTSITRPVPGELGHRFPQFLPDGRRFIFWIGPGLPEVQGLYLSSLDAAEKHRLVAADGSGAYAHPGYLLWPRQGALVAAPFDAVLGTVSGDAEPIVAAVGSNVTTNRTAFSVSNAGLLAYRTGVTGRVRLVWMDRGGTVMQVLGSPDENTLLYPEPSPDGQRIVVQRTVQGNMDIWQIDAARGIPSRVTIDANVDSTAFWSPDGNRLIFRSNRNGVYDLYEKPASGTEDEQRLFTSTDDKIPSDWSTDGRFLLYVNENKETGRDLWALPLQPQGVGTPFPLVRSRFGEDQGQFSSDGRWIAYRTNESGLDEIYVQAFPGPGGKTRVSTQGGSQPRWRRDGKELFFVAPNGTLMAVPVALPLNGQAPNVGAPVALFATRLTSRGSPKQQYAVAPDGQRFLMVVSADETIIPTITVVQNWLAGLQVP
jgi:serine/threonine protein kinase/Tol biopolymer transport system component